MIVYLIKEAKSIVSNLLKHWGGGVFHYSEGDYQFFREGFWNSINNNVLMSTSHFLKNQN